MNTNADQSPMTQAGSAQAAATGDSDDRTQLQASGATSRRKRPFFSRGLVFGVSVLAAAFVCAASLLSEHTVLGQNDASRWDTVWSLINGQSYIIDYAPYSTIDKVYRDGHFYSSKPALLPTVAAGITAAGSRLTGLSLAPGEDYWLVRLVLLLLNCIPFALFVYAYGHWLVGLACDDFAKVFCLYSAAFGTYLTAYSITLNNHTVAALGAFFSLYLLLQILSGGAPRPQFFLLCGICSAWTVANELISWPLWVFTFWCVFKVDRLRTVKLFLPGTAVVVGAFLVTNYSATGDFIPFYLKPGLYRYPGSYWEHPLGIDASAEPKWLYLFNHIVGHHGILSLSPIFVFAIAGAFSRRTFPPFRLGAVVLTALNLLFVVFGTHNYGGACQGARWFMWLIPLWLFCMPLALHDLCKSRRWRVFSLVCLAISIGSVIYAVWAHPAGPWSRSWLHDLMRAGHLVDY